MAGKLESRGDGAGATSAGGRPLEMVFAGWRHRHLDVPVFYPSVDAAESIFERAPSSVVLELIRRAALDPDGELARAVETAAARSEVYGWPALARETLSRARGEAPLDLQALSAEYRSSLERPLPGEPDSEEGWAAEAYAALAGGRRP